MNYWHCPSVQSCEKVNYVISYYFKVLQLMSFYLLGCSPNLHPFLFMS